MKITQEQLERLAPSLQRGDDEGFHSIFDDLLQERLMELDSEWMKEMEEFYEKSGMQRWCA